MHILLAFTTEVAANEPSINPETSIGTVGLWSAVGPFATFDEAMDWAKAHPKHCGDSFEIIEVTAPDRRALDVAA